MLTTVYIEFRVSLNIRSVEDEHELRKGRVRKATIIRENKDVVDIVNFKIIGKCTIFLIGSLLGIPSDSYLSLPVAGKNRLSAGFMNNT